MNGRIARCDGCGAPIQWRRTPAGKAMPLDLATLPAYAKGAYVLVGERECRMASPLLDVGATLYMNHWATCPQAAQFKHEKRSL